MTDIVSIKGSEAVRKVLRRMQAVDGLRTEINRVALNGNVQSCNYTAEAVSNIISRDMVSNSIVTVPPTLDSLASLLQQPKMIYIWITPDHHFIVVPVGSGQMMLLQAFQDTYDLLDWLRSPGSGLRPIAGFMTDMGELLSLHPATRMAAAVRLFSIPGSDADIRDYYEPRAVTLKTVASRHL